MRWKIPTAVFLFVCFLLAGGFPPPCGAEDYVAKKGVALYRVDLQNLGEQILKLDPTDKDQREFLDRLFQMKFDEAERMFQVCGDDQQVKRLIAELYVLKAIVADAMGNWIQSYFAVKDAASWNGQTMTQSLHVNGKAYNVATFSNELESKAQTWGNKVRFKIKPFPPEQMFRPEKVVLARSEEEEDDDERVASTQSRPRTRHDPGSSPGGRWDTAEEPREKMKISPKDEAYLFDRFTKAMYAYYYNPVERNAEFDVFLPHGSYYVYEKDFTIHPVDFEVSDRSTKVILQPARWFRLTISDEVHPSTVNLSFHGMQWKDFDHVPFGSYRVHVKSNQFTGPAVRVNFVPKGIDSSEEEASVSKGETIVIEDRGEYKLSLRKRTGNEKIRYTLLGF